MAPLVAAASGKGSRVNPYRWDGADLELLIRAQPGARRTEVQGVHAGAIKIKLNAKPVDGAANDALLAFLAETLQTPRRRCVLVSGQTSRQKRVRIEAPDRALAERVLASWLQISS
jgi:uncharacterized protein (TIGR00251 family)